MRILKNALEQIPWKRELECPSCKSLLEVEESDIMTYMQDDQRDGPYEALCIVCPVCNCRIGELWRRMEYVRYERLRKKLTRNP